MRTKDNKPLFLNNKLLFLLFFVLFFETFFGEKNVLGEGKSRLGRVPSPV